MFMLLYRLIIILLLSFLFTKEINHNNDRLLLVQIDAINDSLLYLADSAVPNLELYQGPASYHSVINNINYERLTESISSDYLKVIDDNYIQLDYRDYWVNTIYGSNYYGSTGEVGNTCMCLDASNCVVVGYNDSWYNPFDYYGEAWWNFSPPNFDNIAEARIYVRGGQCDNLPLYSETDLSIRNNNCTWNENFQVTLSLNYTENGPYIIPDSQLEDIWCQGGLQPVIGSEDNYSVDWVRMELYYSCTLPDEVLSFQASNQEFCDYVEIEWAQNETADSYKLYRDGEFVTQFSSSSTSFIDYQASADQQHTYCIYSENQCGLSESTCMIGSRKFAPSPINDVTATDGDFQDRVVITWEDNQSYITYKLYRDNTQLSIISSEQELIYIDEFVEPQNIYEYCIEGLNECGESSWICDLGFVGIGQLGDINLDEVINILDVVLLLNFILEIEYPNENQSWLADMNTDQILNVLDIIELVNLIINL